MSTDAPSLYVYGVMRSDSSPEVRSATVQPSGGRATMVRSERLAALVSPIVGTLRATKENLLAHQDVVEEARQAGTIIPLRFGTVVADEATLGADLFVARRSELESLLDECDGCAEYRVEARYKEDVAVRDAVASTPRIGRLQRRMASQPGRRSYQDQIAFGQLIASAVERLAASDADRMGEALARWARRSRRLEGGEGIAFRGAFLVSSTSSDDFDRELERLASAQADRLAVAVTGPLAPWDFVAQRPATAARRGRRPERRRAWAS